eukprot:TRINITY_DN794_c0_g2_i2.p1 TRINITY_DN794_c0_g2~~TRINITY_DN794_c0_g2_i2.p1  ORF type:complete len:582 (+),score=98.81 TRINITY_DN794_c0_g2_i2:51-1748(+)
MDTELKALLVHDKASEEETRSSNHSNKSVSSLELESGEDVPDSDAAKAYMPPMRQGGRHNGDSFPIGSRIPSIRQSYQYYKYIGLIPISFLVGLALLCWFGLPKLALSLWITLYKKSGPALRALWMASLCLIPLKRGISLAYAIYRYRQEEAKETSPFRFQHFVVIPAYNEPVAVLARTLKSLPRRHANSEKSVRVIMAMEAKNTTYQETFEELQRMFEDQFDSFEVTVHTLLPSERAGKGSNENYALRRLRERIWEEGGDLWQCMVTVCDADSVFAPNYFDALESAYARQLDGCRMIYSAPRNTYRNFGQLWNPVIAATESVMNSADMLRDVTEPYENYSNYSLLLGYASMLDFWDAEVIPEDFHMVYRSMICSHGSESVCRIWSLISNDTVTGFADRYVQAKRHNWGVTSIAWILAICRHAPFSIDRLWAKLLSTYCGEMSSNLMPSTAMLIVFGTAMARMLYLSDDPEVFSAFKLLGVAMLASFVINYLLFFVSEALVWTHLMPKLGDSVEWPSKCQLLWLYGTMPFVGPISSIIFGNIACFDAIASATWSSEFEYVCAPKA